MTCIAALRDKTEVWIGGDSASLAGMAVTIRQDPKVFRNRNFLVGCTSSFRFMQILRYSFIPPEHRKGVSVHRYLSTTFVDAMRLSLKAGGFAEVKDNVETGGFCIVGYRGGLYQIESDFQVAIPRLPYTAVGCGADYALGALHATMGFRLTPKKRILLALTASCQFSSGVRPPFVVRRGRRKGENENE